MAIIHSHHLSLHESSPRHGIGNMAVPFGGKRRRQGMGRLPSRSFMSRRGRCIATMVFSKSSGVFQAASSSICALLRFHGLVSRPLLSADRCLFTAGVAVRPLCSSAFDIGIGGTGIAFLPARAQSYISNWWNRLSIPFALVPECQADFLPTPWVSAGARPLSTPAAASRCC